MEEEDEQEDQDQDQDQEEVQAEVELQPTSPSDLGGVPWKEAVELHAKLRANVEDDVSRDGELEEEEEEEDEEDEEEDEEDEDEDESSDGKALFSWRALVIVAFCPHCPDSTHLLSKPPLVLSLSHSPPLPPLLSCSLSPLCPRASL